MNNVAIVTANFGGADEVRPLTTHDGIDAFYYTDEETQRGVDPRIHETWTAMVKPTYPRSDFSARLRSRYFKHQIHRVDEVRDHRWLVWADSSLYFFEVDFIHEQVERLAARPAHERLLVVPHPHRKTVREEYEFISTQIVEGNEYLITRYANEKMSEQMAWFARRGLSVEAPLYCGGFWIVENSLYFRALWDDWWDQNIRFGMMDQLSLPVVLDEWGCVPQILDVNINSNQHFCHIAHRSAK